MEFPEFFAAAPRITVRDPLAEFLGAASNGIIEYEYADVVKLAGHSCPTVASAYLMTRGALKALYPDALPARGEIRLELRDERTAGATGVIANVASFLTGATCQPAPNPDHLSACKSDQGLKVFSCGA